MKWAREEFLRKRVEALQQQIHDRYFDRSGILFDATDRLFVMSFCDDRPGPEGKWDGRLVVSSVTRYWIEGVDKTEAGWDLLNVLRYDEKAGLLRLRGCIWSTTVLSVGPDFCVEVVRA